MLSADFLSHSRCNRFTRAEKQKPRDRSNVCLPTRWYAPGACVIPLARLTNTQRQLFPLKTRKDRPSAAAAVFVVLDRKALEERVASGAGGGGELAFHVFIMLKIQLQVTSSLSYYYCFSGGMVSFRQRER